MQSFALFQNERQSLTWSRNDNSSKSKNKELHNNKNKHLTIITVKIAPEINKEQILKYGTERNFGIEIPIVLVSIIVTFVEILHCVPFLQLFVFYFKVTNLVVTIIKDTISVKRILDRLQEPILTCIPWLHSTWCNLIPTPTACSPSWTTNSSKAVGCRIP